MTPIKVALTGGIGSGKSYIADIFRHLNIPIFESDVEAKKLYLNNSVVQFVYDNIGKQIVNSDNSVNFAKLAEIVFTDRNKLTLLNSYIHPKVMDEYVKWSETKQCPYTINESAIIFENDLTSYFDFIITVIADTDIRIARAIGRGVNVTQDDVICRMKNQVEDPHRLNNSSFIIKNNPNNLLLPQILEISAKIIEKINK